MKIVVIEDDIITRNIIESTLKQEGVGVSTAEAGSKGLELVKAVKPEGIILDLGLPDTSGFEIMKEIKNNPEKYGSPFVMIVTVYEECDFVVKGFDEGADEYIKKPFYEKELVARLSVLQRIHTNMKKNIKYSGLIINTKDLTVYVEREDDIVHLYKKEMELLEYFIENKGIVLSRENISRNVWHRELEQGERYVDVYMSRLKNKLPMMTEKIKVIWGMGYRLEKE